jgi:hypothetical protein
MPDDTKPLSEWARRRAAGKVRRARLIEQREGFFELLLSGHSVEEIANAKGVSASAVRRAVGQAIAPRRLDRPERYAKLQIVRLTKALRSADAWLDQGELSAIEPFLKVVAALDRCHGAADPPSQAEHPARRSRASRAETCAKEAATL